MTNGQFEELVYKIGYHLRAAVQAADPTADPGYADVTVSQLIGPAVADIKSLFDYGLTKGDAEAVWRARAK